MRSENTTGHNRTQQGEVDADPVLNLLSVLDAGQLIAIAALIESERAFASRWWTYLNEMRFRRELPDWVAKQAVGRHADYDQWDEAGQAVNRALFGERRLGHDAPVIGAEEGTLAISMRKALEGESIQSAPQNAEIANRGASLENGR